MGTPIDLTPAVSSGVVAPTGTYAGKPTYMPYRAHVMWTGQSRSIGVGATTVINGTQPYDNEMLDHIRVKEKTGAGSYVAFVDLIEEAFDTNERETGVAAMANHLLDRLAQDGYGAVADQGFRILGSSAGRGGQALAQIGPGGPYYTDMFEMIDAAQALSATARETYGLLASTLVHGETDQLDGLARTTYARDLVAMHKAMVTGAYASTGINLQPPMLICQLASHGHYADAGSPHIRPEIALAQLDTEAMHADMRVVLPGYCLGYNADEVHQQSDEYVMIGKYFARDLAEVIMARRNGIAAPPSGLKVKGVSWQNNAVDVEFYPRTGCELQFKTSWVAAATNQGFDLYSPDGATLIDTITSVTLAEGAHVVRIKYTGSQPSGTRLAYAHGRGEITTGRTDGPRGNLCNNRGALTALDTYTDSGAVSRVMDDYCPIFESIKP